MTTPSTDWKENVPDGEDAALQKLAEELVAPSEAKAIGRALHLKQHVGAKATLAVGDVPEHARHGLFAKPATYDAYVRFSNGAGRHQRDSVPDARGLGLKVLGVGGKKVIPGLEDKKTQDFLFITTSSIPFRTADEFVGFVTAARGGQLLLFPRLASRIGLGRAFGILRALLATNKPFRTYAGAHMFTAVPARFGPFAARFKLEPVGERDDSIVSSGDDSLGADLRARLAKAPLEWDLCAQFFTDEERTPIEDATVDWDTPYTKLARLTVPRQDLDTPEGKSTSELIDTLSFDPWHAMVEHRPLGHIMRARNHAYRLSTQARNAAPEPE